MLETSAPGTTGSDAPTYAQGRRSQLDRQAALDGPGRVSFTFDPKVVTTFLFGTVMAFVLLDALLNVAQFSLGYDFLFGLVPLLDLNRERNLPTWLASMQLGFVAVLLGFIGSNRTRRVTWWRALALGFAFLSLDEFMALHERLNPVMERVVGNDGVLGFPWVAVGIPVAGAVAIAFAGWLRDLPAPTRRRVLLAGGLYVGGALAFESLGGVIYRSAFGPHLLYAMTTTVEEGLELIGVTLFIAALLQLVEHGTELSS